ncbi:MAG: hypothetical protein H0U75_00590 [Legionella sp.]|nr:hypothetical protein [Legionella sp.]
MEKWSKRNRFFRFVYQHLLLRFAREIREPYLIRVDNICPHIKSNELSVDFHIVNKRVSQGMSVAEFVKTDMIYLVDPRIVFDMGQQFGSHAEKLLITKQKEPNFKSKCASTLKRVFIDE